MGFAHQQAGRIGDPSVFYWPNNPAHIYSRSQDTVKGLRCWKTKYFQPARAEILSQDCIDRRFNCVSRATEEKNGGPM